MFYIFYKRNLHKMQTVRINYSKSSKCVYKNTYYNSHKGQVGLGHLLTSVFRTGFIFSSHLTKTPTFAWTCLTISLLHIRCLHGPTLVI